MCDKITIASHLRISRESKNNFRTSANSIGVPAGIYLLKVNNNRSTRTTCELCSKLTIKIFEHISHLVFVLLLVFLLISFEHVIAGWVTCR